MASDDPKFERKKADIIGVYLHPPQDAAVFGVDEKSAIQALDRLDPVLPMSPATARCPLYAALDVRRGRVHGQTAARHTSRISHLFRNRDRIGRCDTFDSGQHDRILQESRTLHPDPRPCQSALAQFPVRVLALLAIQPRLHLRRFCFNVSAGHIKTSLRAGYLHPDASRPVPRVRC
jgi:hypothetical protein